MNLSLSFSLSLFHFLFLCTHTLHKQEDFLLLSILSKKLFSELALQSLCSVSRMHPQQKQLMLCLTHSSPSSVPENGIIKSDKVYDVMLATDRAHFSRCNPYMDSPQSIGGCPGKHGRPLLSVRNRIFSLSLDWLT